MMWRHVQTRLHGEHQVEGDKVARVAVARELAGRARAAGANASDPVCKLAELRRNDVAIGHPVRPAARWPM
jgi:hypothetical protein